MLLHTDFYVRSIDNSLKFYIDAIGFRLADEFEVKGNLVSFISKGQCTKCRVVLLKIGAGGAMLELIEFLDKQKDDLELSEGSVTLWVPSLDKKILELNEKGFKPISDIFCVDSNKFGRSNVVFFNDYDQNKIEFLEKIK